MREGEGKRNIAIEVNIPQGQFLAMPQKFRAFVGGYGSGKTVIISLVQTQGYWEAPKINQGYFAPTYSHIRDIFFPTIEEVAYWMGLKVEIRESNKEVHFYSGRAYRGTTICRSMDNPSKIVGFKIGHASIDELDLLPIDKAETAWRKIMARRRWQGARNGIDVATTPEGFRFTYKMFKALPDQKPELRENYGLIQASTYDNEANLPDDYIESMREIYPDELIDAYLDGQFVNLTSGTIYRAFTREANSSTETIKNGEALHIGMDFNVAAMVAILHVKRPNGLHAAGEIVDVFDTPEMIRIIQERYPKRKIYIYPDASGASRKTVNASETDIALLEVAGFRVIADDANPPVKNRILSVNVALAAGKYHINLLKCPTLIKTFEQQTYDKNGEPDKTTGLDHPGDAAGYAIWQIYPVKKPVSNLKVRFAV